MKKYDFSLGSIMLIYVQFKKFVLTVIILILSTSTVTSQDVFDKYCGTAKELNYNLMIPQSGATNNLILKNTSPILGESRTFYSGPFHDRRYVNATCRAIGENCYIFVEDSVWGVPATITLDEIQGLLLSLDKKTTKASIDSTKGIFEIEIEYFGSVPDEIDNDPKIYILYLATDADGYFSAFNQRDEPLSNKIEMIYIAADVNNRYPNQRKDYHKHIISHELLHLIHWGRSPYTFSSWVHEGCAEFATYICGYYEPGIMDSLGYNYLSNYSNLSLTKFSYEMSYSLTFTFMLYLSEKYGIKIISDLLASDDDGINAINRILLSYGYSMQFSEVFQNWQLAIYLDHIDPVDPTYRFDDIDIPPFKHVNNHNSYPFSTISDTIQSWAGQFIGFTVEPNLQILFEGCKGFKIFLVSARSQENITIEPIKLDDNYGGTIQFDKNDTLTLLVSNQSNQSAYYKYSASYSTLVAGVSNNSSKKNSFYIKIIRIPLTVIQQSVFYLNNQAG